MASKNTLLNIFIIAIGVSSFSYAIVDNVNQLKEYNARMEDTAALLNSRTGTSIIANKPSDMDVSYYPDIYLLTDEAAQQIQLTKDPFTEVEGLPDFKLTGMIHSGDQPSAVINDQVVSAGEYMGSFQVLKIGSDFVKLSDGKYTIELHLYLPEPEESLPPEDSPPPEDLNGSQ